MSKRAGNEAELKLDQESERSEQLLLNILPEQIAHRLKLSNKLIADRNESATVMFADLVNFTPLSMSMSANQVLVILNEI